MKGSYRVLESDDDSCRNSRICSGESFSRSVVAVLLPPLIGVSIRREVRSNERCCCFRLPLAKRVDEEEDPLCLLEDEADVIAEVERILNCMSLERTYFLLVRSLAHSLFIC